MHAFLGGLSLVLPVLYGLCWVMGYALRRTWPGRIRFWEYPMQILLLVIRPSPTSGTVFEPVAWRMGILYGMERAGVETRQRLGRLALWMYAAFWAGVFLNWLDSSTYLYLELSGMLTIGLPFLWFRDLSGRIRLARRQAQLDFQPFVDKVALLVNAGDTLQQAVMRCLPTDQGEAPNLLNREFRRLSAALANHEPFASALEQFSRRMRTPEVSRFTSTVLIHYRRGGEECAAALRELSRQMWESRMALVRIMAEETSAKLTIPLVALFVLVMIVAAVPAILMLQH